MPSLLLFFVHWKQATRSTPHSKWHRLHKDIDARRCRSLGAILEAPSTSIILIFTGSYKESIRYQTYTGFYKKVLLIILFIIINWLPASIRDLRWQPHPSTLCMFCSSGLKYPPSQLLITWELLNHLQIHPNVTSWICYCGSLLYFLMWIWP